MWNRKEENRETLEENNPCLKVSADDNHLQTVSGRT